MEKTAAKLDSVKLLAALGKGMLRGAKYAPPAIAIGAVAGASLGDTAKTISGNSGMLPGLKLGATTSAATTTLAAAALEILKDPILRKTKEGKIAAGLVAALSLGMAWRGPNSIMTANVEKEASWKNVIQDYY